MKPASSTLTGRSLESPITKAGHRNAMIHVCSPPRRRQGRVPGHDDEVVAFDFDFDAVDTQHCGCRRQPVGFLDVQLLQAAHPCFALGERGRHGKIGYSSIIAGARDAGTSTPRSTPERTRRSATSSPPSVRVSIRSIDAPISPSVVSSPIRNGFIITPSSMMSEPAVIIAATRGNAAEDGSAGTTIALRHKFRLAVERHVAAATKIAVRLNADRRSEISEHFLRVVAGRLPLDDNGSPRRGKSSEKDRRLQLRDGTGGSNTMGMEEEEDEDELEDDEEEEEVEVVLEEVVEDVRRSGRRRAR